MYINWRHSKTVLHFAVSKGPVPYSVFFDQFLDLVSAKMERAVVVLWVTGLVCEFF